MGYKTINKYKYYKIVFKKYDKKSCKKIKCKIIKNVFVKNNKFIKYKNINNVKY